MKIALIIAHPSPTSFCAALARTCAQSLAKQGVKVVESDLYAMNFDPRMGPYELPTPRGARPYPDVVAERARIADVDGFLFVYPLWFNAPPAMLKGYVDRVLSAGFGFLPTAHGADPLLVGKTLMSVTTSGAPESWLESSGAFNTLMQGFDLHLSSMTGLRIIGHEHVGGVTPDMTPAYGAAALKRVRSSVTAAISQTADG